MRRHSGAGTRRDVLRAGFGLGALATVGGVTAWALLGGTEQPGHTAGAGSARTLSGSPPAPAGDRPAHAGAGDRSASPGAGDRSASPGAGDRPAPVRSAGPGDMGTGRPLPMRYFGPADHRHVYFTIDDGWFPSRRVLEIMKSERVPVTTFLIVDAAREHLSYWRDFVDAGGRIENHTVSHPYLTRLPRGEVEGQWAGAQRAFRRWFGRTPSLGRPPYGAINDSVSAAARNAGLTAMVAWSAVDNTGTVKTWDRRRLSAGEIALSHWDPGVEADLAQLVNAARASGLTPAYLPETW